MRPNMNKEYITEEKKKELEEELEKLTTVDRKEVASALEYAKSLGDLSENAEYQQAREDQARLEDRIGEITYILKNAEIVKPKHTGKVEVGSVVHVKKKGTKTVQRYTIVGTSEADVLAGLISNESQLGKHLIGKQAGDAVTFTNPKGETLSYTIDSIE